MKTKNILLVLFLASAHILCAQINTKVNTGARTKAPIKQTSAAADQAPFFVTQASAKALPPKALSKKQIAAKSKAVKKYVSVPANATKVNATLTARKPYHHNAFLVGSDVTLNANENLINVVRSVEERDSEITIHLRQVRGKKYLVTLTLESANSIDMNIATYSANSSRNTHSFTLTGGTQQKDIVLQAQNSGFSTINIHCWSGEWNFKKAVIKEIE